MMQPFFENLGDVTFCFSDTPIIGHGMVFFWMSQSRGATLSVARGTIYPDSGRDEELAHKILLCHHLGKTFVIKGVFRQKHRDTSSAWTLTVQVATSRVPSEYDFFIETFTEHLAGELNLGEC